MTVKECWEFMEVHFGFASRRKYGFLHSSWETVRARKTGSPASCLDYVVYRLFYTLAISGVGVITIAQSDAYSIFSFFETWILLLHILYAFLFLRQVLAHNVYRKVLGRGQKMPEELFITDEIIRDGRKYYISKKLSVLPRQSLSAYEKLIWIVFNTVAPLTLASFLAQSYLLNVLVQCEKNDRVTHLISTTFGVLLIIIDVFSNVLPMRTGHFIHALGFLLVYFLSELGFDYKSTKCTGNSIEDLYQYPTYSYPRFLYLIILTIVSSQIIHVMKMFRDFLISLFDLSRTEAVKQRLRAQKRLARRKIMHEIRGPDGKIQHIALDHVTPSQEDLICWRENEEEIEEFDWAGDSETDLHNLHMLNRNNHFHRVSDPTDVPPPDALRKSGVYDDLKAQLAKIFHKNDDHKPDHHEVDVEKGTDNNKPKSHTQEPNVTRRSIEADYEIGLNIRLPTPPRESLSDKPEVTNRTETANADLDFETTPAGDWKLQVNKNNYEGVHKTGSQQQIYTSDDSKADIPDCPEKVCKRLKISTETDDEDETDLPVEHEGKPKAKKRRKGKGKGKKQHNLKPKSKPKDPK